MTSTLCVSLCTEACCGIINNNTFISMKNKISPKGYDPNGNPCDYVDEDGVTWIYIGNPNGVDEWMGIPKED